MNNGPFPPFLVHREGVLEGFSHLALVVLALQQSPIRHCLSRLFEIHQQQFNAGNVNDIETCLQMLGSENMF
jgi:hypothetical protein